MGAWGIKPLENNIAMDWLSLFINDKVDTNYLISQAKSALELEDNEDIIRVISLLFAFFNYANYWPKETLTEFNAIKEGLEYELRKMIEPGSEYLELWDNDKDLIHHINLEIKSLLG